jgi:penicillin-binding protein 2
LFHCHKAHGFVDLNRAIVNSCNVFFYNVGKNLGIEKIADHAKAVGLGEKTRIDLPDERSGVFPSPEWKLRTRGEKWYAGETISVAIGQGAMAVTPVQLARAIGIIATGGKVVWPHVLLQPQMNQLKNQREALKRREKKDLNAFLTTLHAGPSKNGEVLDVQPAQINEGTIPISEKTRQTVVKGMWGVVNEWGTGTAAKVEGLNVCGKTGTAQTISDAGRTKIKSEEKSRFKDNAWFVGFAPKDNPEIVVAVLVERGGFGGQASAPIAGALIREYFRKKTDSPMNLLATSSQ